MYTRPWDVWLTHLDGTGVSDEGTRLDRVDQGLAQSELLDAAKVKAIHAVPDYEAGRR
jgi:hypothetical protein